MTHHSQIIRATHALRHDTTPLDLELDEAAKQALRQQAVRMGVESLRTEAARRADTHFREGRFARLWVKLTGTIR